MTPILIIAGVLAALILFRWARTLLIFGIAAAAVWFFMTHAHAYTVDQTPGTPPPPIYHNRVAEQEGAMLSEARRRFNATHPGTAQALYINDEFECRRAEGQAYVMMISYREFIKHGMTSRQAIQQSSHSRLDYRLGELAASAPDTITPDEFRVRILGRCLEIIAD